jgi:adenylyltransferase/sulfurtransferase
MSERYSRQTILPEIGEAGQQKLGSSHIAIVGCGGLGAIAAAYLAGVGVGHMSLIDGDIPDVSNLHRQVFYTEKDKLTKVEHLKTRLNALNPEIKIDCTAERLSKNNIDELLTGVDLVLECTDDQMCKYLVNDFCALEGIPLVYGAIHKYEGYVSLFRNSEESDTHLRDIFPLPDINIPVCSEVGVLNTIAGLIGILQANEAIKYILDIGNTLHGKLLTYDILACRQMILNLQKNWDKDIEQLYDESDYKTPACDHILEIEPSQLREQRSELQLISVMKPSEHQAIDEQCHHIEYENLNDKQLDKSKKKIVIYCRSGRVSRMACSRLLEEDPQLNIYSLKGGYSAYLKYVNQSI